MCSQNGNEKANQARGENAAEDLARVLVAGLVEQFMKNFRNEVLSRDDEDYILELADEVNAQILVLNPDCDVKLAVSQKTPNEKRIVMITDGSRFFGDSWTITRKIFSV